MFLTATNIVYYLLERAFIDPSDVLQGQIKIIEAGRRNRNFKILVRKSGLFLKQVKAIDPIENTTLQREAECYSLAQKYPAWSQVMTRFLGFDQARKCLALELLPNAESFVEYQFYGGALNCALAASVGDAFASFHRLCPVLDAAELTSVSIPRRVPWILFFHRDNNRVSQGVIALGDRIRSDSLLSSTMDRLCEAWSRSAWIHGDMKWDNILICDEKNGSHKVIMIDWELFDLGDPLWDVGGFIHSFMVSSVGRKLNAAPSEHGYSTDLVIEDLKQSSQFLAAMWNQYAIARSIDGEESRLALLRTMEFAAARMLQTAFEGLYYRDSLSDEAEYLLGMTKRIFANTSQFIDELGLCVGDLQ